MAAQKPKVRSDLTVVELEGEAVIYVEEPRQVHYLNRTATIVFNLCDGTSTIKELSGDIAEAFSLPAAEVERQVRTLLRSFRDAGFMEGTSTNGTVSSNGKPKAKTGKATGTLASRRPGGRATKRSRRS